MEKMNVQRSMTELIQSVKEWSKERGLHTADPSKQMLKLMEELGETAQALCKGDFTGLIDGIGDMLVVITILCQQLKLTPEYCLEMAYREIKDRRGRMVGGVFVKEADLANEEA